jgi:hypothetical protein
MLSLPLQAPPAPVVSASCSRLYPSPTRMLLCPPTVVCWLFVEWHNGGIHHIYAPSTRTHHPRLWLSLFRAFLSQSWFCMRWRCPHGSCRAPAGSLGRIQCATSSNSALAWVDRGCSWDMVPTRQAFLTCTPLKDCYVTVANSERIPCAGLGTAVLTLHDKTVKL